MSSCNSNLANCNSNLSTCYTNWANSNTNLATCNSNLSTCNANVFDLTSKNNDLTNKWSTCNTSLTTCTANVSNLTKQNSDLTSQLAAVTAKNEENYLRYMCHACTIGQVDSCMRVKNDYLTCRSVDGKNTALKCMAEKKCTHTPYSAVTEYLADRQIVFTE